MLLLEQEELLKWIDQHHEGVSLLQMQDEDAPFFSNERIVSLQKAGLLECRPFEIVYNDQLLASYKLTDEGRLALVQMEEMRNECAKKERQQRFENKVSVANVLVPAITFILGMLVEHFSGFLWWLDSLFK